MMNEINQYKTPAMRDLVWMLLSPDLISQWNHKAWFREQYNLCQNLFIEIDKNPDDFLKDIKFWPKNRLGHYFESLVVAWLNIHPHYEILHQNLQLHKEKQTIGEFDLIVRHLKNNKIEHWELSVKFYLGYGNTALNTSWYGLQFMDRLDIKTNRLATHQSQLSTREEALSLFSELGISIDEVKVIFKGRLFYPQNNKDLPEGSNPDHLKSGWVSIDIFENNDSHHLYDWVVLKKDFWLSARSGDDDCVSFDELISSIHDQRKFLPLFAAAIKEGQEVFRVCVVKEGWKVPEEFKI